MAEREAILVIDDECGVAVRVCQHLAARGFAVRHAASGEEAFAILGSLTPSERFDHALVDVQLRDGSGEAVLEACARLRPRPNLIVTSANLGCHQVSALIGQSWYLPKPVALGPLVAALERLGKMNLQNYARRKGLSNKEFSVLCTAVEGLSLDEAAVQLGCKVSTVKTYWQRIYTKTGLSRQTSLLGEIIRWQEHAT